jgi:predicted GIY-YIG superfamily endonuclease
MSECDLRFFWNSSPHACYLITSPHRGKTYIGYSSDPGKRIRQHNGLIVGGAKRTKRGRPWSFFCIVSGFQDKHQALSFEWHWQHPSKGLKGPSIDKRLNVLAKLLSKSTGVPLTIVWFQPRQMAQQFRAHEIQLVN